MSENRDKNDLDKNDLTEENNKEIELKYSELFESDTDTDTLFTPENTDDEQTISQSEEKKKKRIRYALIIGGVIIAILLAIYIWGVFYYKNHFLPGTEINGIDVSNDTVDQALLAIQENISGRQVQIEGSNNVTNTVSSTEIDLTFDNQFGDLQKLLNNQDEYFWEIQSLTKKDIELRTYYYYDEDKLNTVVSSLSLVNGPNVQAPQNAKISYNGSEYVIDPAVEGDQPNTNRLKKGILDSLIENESTLNLKTKGIYNTPEITADNETLKSNLEKFNTAVKSVITITFPSKQVVLDKDTFHSWLVADGDNVTVDDNQLNTYVAQLADQFNNNGHEVSFRASSGRTYTFQYNSGWELNQAGEAAQIKPQILEGAVVTENPVWTRQGSNFITGNTITGNYIEISLNDQTLWFYKNNTLVSYSTIVSGDVQTNHATSTGLYFLQSKDSNVNLVVRQLDGSTTNTQVRYWLPYTQNIGIESATWRTDFGGEIYRTQGTDGDIDAPLDMTQTLYDSADVGVPVVIY